jgi:hypothetical protein
MFRARLRFQLEVNAAWEPTEALLTVGELADGGPWQLKRVTASSLGHGESWALTSSRMPTADAARRVGESAQMSLVRIALNRGFGVSFAARVPPGMIFDAGLQMLAGPGETVLRDQIGLQVYEDAGAVRFASLNPVRPLVTSQATNVFAQWHEEAAFVSEFDARVALAFDLLSSSRSESSTRARFLLLVMAVEALLDSLPRPENEVALIASFQKQVSATTLSDDSKARLISAIGNLKSESIGKAAQALMERLGGSEAAALFKRCYRLRSSLVHGGTVVDIAVISNAAAELEPLVRTAILDRFQRAAG